MASHPLEHVIQAADQAITAGELDALMDFYAPDATLVVKPGLNVSGRDNIRAAFVKIAEYVMHSLVVRQGRVEVIEGRHRSGDHGIPARLRGARQAGLGDAARDLRVPAGGRWKMALPGR